MSPFQQAVDRIIMGHYGGYKTAGAQRYIAHMLSPQVNANVASKNPGFTQWLQQKSLMGLTA